MPLPRASQLAAAKAATQWRANPDADDGLFADAPGVVVVLRNVNQAEQIIMQGTWLDPPLLVCFGTYDRYWRKALQLWDRTWLFVEVSK